MTQVADEIKVDLTDPGLPSRPMWGHKVNSRYSWNAEYVHSTVGSDYDYRVVHRKGRWTLARTENGYIASDTLTGIFGFGPSAKEAARDLGDALHQHRDVLERQEALSPALQEQLDYLRDLL
jgi:hypothetical protein